jgi:hypothetical protein
MHLCEFLPVKICLYEIQEIQWEPSTKNGMKGSISNVTPPPHEIRKNTTAIKINVLCDDNFLQAVFRELEFHLPIIGT